MSRSTYEMSKHQQFINADVSPLEIVYLITGKCNFNCDFCAFKDANKFKDMPVENTIKFVEDLKNYLSEHPTEKFFVNVIGGEPFINMSKFEEHFNILNQLRECYPDNIELGVYTNGFFASTDNLLQRAIALNIDTYYISCSKAHFKHGNYKYLPNILKSDFGKTHLEFNVIDPWDTVPMYTKALLELGVSQEDIDFVFNSSSTSNTRSCISLCTEQEVLDFYKEAEHYVEECMYKPFGIFITNGVTYTACGGEGRFPWCELPTDLAQAINYAKQMYIKVDQYLKPDCLLTCKHFQQKGYCCYDRKHISIDKDFNITER